MGLLHLRRGEFGKAEDHFARALLRLTFRNPNPYDGEPFYNLGLARLYLGKTDEAYDVFYKSTWNHAWQSAGNYALACISAGRGDLQLALEQVEKSLRTNVDHLKARALKAALLRRLGRTAEAQAVIDASLALDRLDFRMMAETVPLVAEQRGSGKLRRSPAWRSRDAARCELRPGVERIAGRRICSFRNLQQRRTMESSNAVVHAGVAGRCPAQGHARGEIPSQGGVRLPALLLSGATRRNDRAGSAIARNPAGPRAHYYLGNLYYDKRRYDEGDSVLASFSRTG